MHAGSDSVASNRSLLTSSFDPMKSRHSPLTWSRLARSTAITGYTSVAVESFTTPASRTACGAGRWRKFLSRNSQEAATSEFGAMRPSSILAKWWSVRARVWVNQAIDC